MTSSYVWWSLSHPQHCDMVTQQISNKCHENGHWGSLIYCTGIKIDGAPINLTLGLYIRNPFLNWACTGNVLNRNIPIAIFFIFLINIHIEVICFATQIQEIEDYLISQHERRNLFKGKGDVVDGNFLYNVGPQIYFSYNSTFIRVYCWQQWVQITFI